MTAPERIWHHPFTDIVVHDAQPERHWECNEYIRADLVQEIVAEALKTEREACARVCETLGALGGVTPNPRAEWKTHADNLAAAIRARGEG